jgi:uncharacterized membrane protein YdbT with pleckstrin-like domain
LIKSFNKKIIFLIKIHETKEKKQKKFWFFYLLFKFLIAEINKILTIFTFYSIEEKNVSINKSF